MTGTIIARMIWLIFITGGCAYLVFGLGQSGWWFAPAVALMFMGAEVLEGK